MDMSTPSDEESLEVYAPVYAFVRTVPRGRVVTYGQVAGMIQEVSLTARQVGTAMRYAPKDVPWQRVVGAGGHLPIGKLSAEKSAEQRRLLTEEGVTFLPHAPERIDMAQHQWLLQSSEQGSLFEE